MALPNPFDHSELASVSEYVLEQERMSAASPGSALAQQAVVFKPSQNHNALLQQLAQNPPPTTNTAPWNASVPNRWAELMKRDDDRAHFLAADAALPDSDE